MTAERRDQLLRVIQDRGGPVTGTELAQVLGVSRQIVVQDVAVLRAAGQEVLATPRGYMLQGIRMAGVRAVLATRHTREETEEELTIMVDNGLRVLDVIVEHPLYGELRAPLMLASRSDVRAWRHHLEETSASLLSDLTDGVHLHTVEASDTLRIDQARLELAQRGFLLDQCGHAMPNGVDGRVASVS